MRHRFQRANHCSRQRGPTPAADYALLRQEMIREFGPKDLDLDDLAQAIRRLLNSDEIVDLLSRDRGATHVMRQEET